MAKRLSDAEKPRYVLYFRGHRPPDEHPRMWVPIFWDPGIAHSLILRFLGNAEHSREGNVLRIADSALSLTCEQLEDVLSAEPAPITDELARTVLRFKLGTWEEDHSKKDEVVETVTEDGEVIVEKKPKAPKPVKEKKPGVPDGYKTITELCKEWNLLPMHARAALRGSGLEKPPYGWAFAPKDIKQIKKICGVK